jgi:CHAT domain-containing protein
VIANGNELEGRLISFYRNAIESRIEDQLTYEKFWRPIKMELSGISKIYFSPDGVYNQINLNTLYNSSLNKYLIDEVELVYLTNTADLLKTYKTPSLTSTGILFGRPDYDFLQPVTPRAMADGKEYGKRNILADDLVELKNQDFEDLPGTETEIGTIEKALVSRKIEVRTYKGTDAREEMVKSVSNPSLLHIATHGFFVDDAASQINPMIRSGLVLAGVKNQGVESGDDGILTAYEATNLNLEQTSLVALSACETGLGEIRNGEGVYGLQRAIIVAGAHNLLMSLWKVDDTATATLMSDFYENWNFDDNQTVFRKAQMELRKKYPEPYYWGAFIMLGK